MGRLVAVAAIVIGAIVRIVVAAVVVARGCDIGVWNTGGTSSREVLAWPTPATPTAAAFAAFALIA